MPRIDQAQLPEGTTRPLATPYDETRVPLDSPIGQGLHQLAGGISAAGTRLEEYNRLRVRQVEAAYHADLNEETALYKTLEGNAAIDGYEALKTKLDERLKTRSAELQSEGQRTLFERQAALQARVAMAHVEGHLAQQRRVVEDTTFGRQRAEALKQIANAYSDELTVGRVNGLFRSAITEHAKLIGLPASELEQRWGEAVAQTRLDMFLADKRVGDAQSYLARVKGILPADKLDNYTRTLSGMADAQAADLVAQKIVGDTRGPDGQVDRRKAQALVDTADAKLRDRVQHYVDHRANVYDKAWRDEAVNLAGRVSIAGIDPTTDRFSLALVEGTKNWEDLQRVWPMKAAELMKQARTSNIAELRQAAADKWEQRFAPESWANTAQMSDQEFFAEVAGLLPQDRTRFVNAFRNMKAKLEFTPPESVVLDEARRALSIGKKIRTFGQASNDQREKLADLMDAVNYRVKEWIIEHKGVHPKQDDVRQMTAAELVVTESNFFSPDVRLYQRKTADVPWRAKYRNDSTAPIEQKALEAAGALPRTRNQDVLQQAGNLDRVREFYRKNGLPDPSLDEIQAVLRAEAEGP